MFYIVFITFMNPPVQIACLAHLDHFLSVPSWGQGTIFGIQKTLEPKSAYRYLSFILTLNLGLMLWQMCSIQRQIAFFYVCVFLSFFGR